MRIDKMIDADREIHSYARLDRVLLRLCQLVVAGKRTDADLYGAVAAGVLDPSNRLVMGINLPGPDGTRQHAERVAINRYLDQHGNIPDGSIMITTCSPCSEHMADRHGDSCTQLINDSNIKKVYCGYRDPTQPEDGRTFSEMETADPALRDLCKTFADTFLDYERDQAKEA